MQVFSCKIRFTAMEVFSLDVTLLISVRKLVMSKLIVKIGIRIYVF